HLDAAVLAEIVERSIGRAGDLHAIEINLERAAVIGLGEGRRIAAAFSACGHPILLLIKTLLDVLAGGAAVLGGPFDGFLHVERRADAGEVVYVTVSGA